MVLESLNNNRELYDLCRRYKYYYNAYKKLGELDSIYWNKNLRKAYRDVEKQLNETTLEIAMVIFIKTGVIQNFKVTTTPVIHQTFFGKIYMGNTESESVIYGREFAELIMTLRRKYNLQFDYNIEV